MLDQGTKTGGKQYTIQNLNDILGENNVVTCPDCKGHMFMDLKFRLLSRSKAGINPRYNDYGLSVPVYVCVKDFTPLVNIEGDFFNASTYFDKNEIRNIVQHGLAEAASGIWSAESSKFTGSGRVPQSDLRSGRQLEETGK